MLLTCCPEEYKYVPLASVEYRITYSVVFVGQKTMPIPSVVIEPASSNEGDDDRDVDIISPVAPGGGNGVMTTDGHAPAAGGAVTGPPEGYLYKVSTSLFRRRTFYLETFWNVLELAFAQTLTLFDPTGGDDARL